MMRLLCLGVALSLANCGSGRVEYRGTGEAPDEWFNPDVPDEVPDDPVDDQHQAPVSRVPTPCLDARPPGPEPAGGDADEEPSIGLAIFDKSGSMNGGWTIGEGDAGVPGTKWQAASDALVGALESVQHRVTLGAIFFPQPGECTVAPVENGSQIFFRPGPDFLAAWSEIAPRNGPGGSTPLGAAFLIGEQALEAACADGLLDRRTFVMVVTDGMPNCDTDMGQVEAIARDWLARGIETFVLGLPGFEGATGVLDRIANAGGTETLLVPGSPEELEDDMDDIM